MVGRCGCSGSAHLLLDTEPGIRAVRSVWSFPITGIAMSIPRRLSSLALVLFSAAALACGDDPNDPDSEIEIDVSPTRDTIAVGGSVQLSATVTGTEDDEVDWSSSNDMIATVSSGLVSGVAPGNVTITAAVASAPSRKATAIITVLDGPEATLLTNDVPLTGLSAPAGTMTLYRIEVPAGMGILSVTTSGGSGDVDVVANFGSQPDINEMDGYDCASFGATNSETCNVYNPSQGTYYILLYSSEYSDVTLTASYAESFSSTLLTNGVALAEQSATEGSHTLYRIVVPAGQEQLQVRTTGGTGDVNVVVEPHQPPTLALGNQSCASFVPGNDETCSSYQLEAGTYYILLLASEAYTGVTVSATLSGITSTALTSGVSVTGTAGGAGSETLYHITVPAGTSELTVTTSGSSGDADLFVRSGNPPTLIHQDCSSGGEATSNESCVITSPTAGTYYIMIKGWTAYTDVTVRATVTP